jgi:hypothetical protein
MLRASESYQSQNVASKKLERGSTRDYETAVVHLFRRFLKIKQFFLDFLFLIRKYK